MTPGSSWTPRPGWTVDVVSSKQSHPLSFSLYRCSRVQMRLSSVEKECFISNTISCLSAHDCYRSDQSDCSVIDGRTGIIKWIKNILKLIYMYFRNYRSRHSISLLLNMLYPPGDTQPIPSAASAHQRPRPTHRVPPLSTHDNFHEYPSYI